MPVSIERARISRVLCVDDEVAVRGLLHAAFRSEKIEVDTAVDGLDALANLTRGGAAYDLLVTDTQMPGLGGIGLIERARAAGFQGDIIVFSGSFQEEDRGRYLALGAAGVIAKPNVGELMKLVHALRPTADGPAMHAALPE